MQSLPSLPAIRTNGALASLYLIWGSSYLFIRNMTEAMPPLYMASLRFLLGGSLLYLACRLSGTPRPSARHWQSAAVLGFLLLAVSNGLLVLGLQYVPTGRTALLGGSYPAFLLLLNWVAFGRVRPSATALAGVALGGFGLFVLTNLANQDTAGESAQTMIGSGCILLGNLLWALATLISPRLEQPAPLLSSGMQMLVGGLILFVLSYFSENAQLLHILSAPPKAVWSLLYLVCITSIIGYSCFSYLTRHAPPMLVGTYAFVSPVVAVTLGVLIANESLSATMAFGAVGGLLGVLMMLVGQQTNEESAVRPPVEAEAVEPAEVWAKADN